MDTKLPALRCPGKAALCKSQPRAQTRTWSHHESTIAEHLLIFTSPRTISQPRFTLARDSGHTPWRASLLGVWGRPGAVEFKLSSSQNPRGKILKTKDEQVSHTLHFHFRLCPENRQVSVQGRGTSLPCLGRRQRQAIPNFLNEQGSLRGPFAAERPRARGTERTPAFSRRGIHVGWLLEAPVCRRAAL